MELAAITEGGRISVKVSFWVRITNFAMLRWTNISPGAHARMTDSGTRESALSICVCHVG